MQKLKLSEIFLYPLIVAGVAVLIIDLPTHFFLTSPNETFSYFFTKFIVYYIYSSVFLNFFKLKFLNIAIGGAIIATLWGIYYNILPLLFDYTPYGIALNGIAFLGITNYLITGLLFGLTHTIGFIAGVYGVKLIEKLKQ